MIQGGTLNDFINAITNTGGETETEEIIRYFKRDWQVFLNLVTKLGEHVAFDMAEINSQLSQRSLSIYTRPALGILP